MFYLKYRPQTISELDNEKIKSTLGKSLLNNEFSHAYLLIGTRGSGKTTTARLIAKIVNCEKRKKGEEPCNKCDSCKAITQGSSLDVVEIDAASNTGVEDIRELREKVKLAPISSKFKVYIIDEVHMLSTSAFNALLKTLEEPPTHVIFVLATTDPQKLPATIISRCLVYDFGKASKAEIANSIRRAALGEGIKIDQKDLEMITDRANGSLRDAHKIFEQFSRGEEVGDVNHVEKVAQEILDLKNTKDALKILRDFSESGGRVKELILAMIMKLREEMLAKPENIKLIEKLIEAHSLVKDSPIPELPLELVIVEWGQNSHPELLPEMLRISKQAGVSGSPADAGSVSHSREIPGQARNDTMEIEDKWQEIIAAVKPFNHNLSALLRSSKPTDLKGDFLTIEAFYKFHKDKLSEEKNRKVLEDVVSGIMDRQIKIKFTLKDGDK